MKKVIGQSNLINTILPQKVVADNTEILKKKNYI